MKRTFGTWITRLRQGGDTLTDVEFQLLQQLVDALPTPLRSVVDVQFDAYNLVQRKSDGRALNFYRMQGGKVNREGLPVLKMVEEEAPLVRLTATLEGDAEPIHATLNAVAGHVFCMSLNRSIPSVGVITVLQVKDAWRSNFRGKDL
jgi:hypothetical protein